MLTLILCKELVHPIVSAYRADIASACRYIKDAIQLTPLATTLRLPKSVLGQSSVISNKYTIRQHEMKYFGTVDASTCNSTKRQPSTW
jgi:hypothetical protein